MDKGQLSDLITRTLKGIGKFTPDALNLLKGIAAQESHLYFYIKQIGNGPALGGFQMEPATFNDIVNNYLVNNNKLSQLIKAECGVVLFDARDLEFNMKLAICFTRCHFLRLPDALPNTIEGMAKLYKQKYNTVHGAATEEEFIENYHKFVL